MTNEIAIILQNIEEEIIEQSNKYNTSDNDLNELLGLITEAKELVD